MGFSDFDLEAFLASAEMQGGFKGLPKWCPGAAFGTKMSDVTVIGRVGGVTAFGGAGGLLSNFGKSRQTPRRHLGAEKMHISSISGVRNRDAYSL